MPVGRPRVTQLDEEVGVSGLVPHRGGTVSMSPDPAQGWRVVDGP